MNNEKHNSYNFRKYICEKLRRKSIHEYRKNLTLWTSVTFYRCFATVSHSLLLNEPVLSAPSTGYFAQLEDLQSTLLSEDSSRFPT